MAAIMPPHRGTSNSLRYASMASAEGASSSFTKPSFRNRIRWARCSQFNPTACFAILELRRGWKSKGCWQHRTEGVCSSASVRVLAATRNSPRLRGHGPAPGAACEEAARVLS
ncbi:hypothetical protein BRADI_4g32702v3 [Brachypodium distachyon]|uniref:Uncharacterized protein n=1 Tax=Brachypodium distachyon TaxID=15368 RepID=A0A2K2CRU8_BRADI|nr:hypothetical protein BRADI_4g32702v3 [Brachypodium distachyon]